MRNRRVTKERAKAAIGSHRPETACSSYRAGGVPYLPSAACITRPPRGAASSPPRGEFSNRIATATVGASAGANPTNQPCGAPEGFSALPVFPATLTPRSEEHTSELQSQSNLVCRLLLEKN